MARELTREEKRAIHKLVKSLCANYDKDYGCLLGLGPRANIVCVGRGGATK